MTSIFTPILEDDWPVRGERARAAVRRMALLPMRLLWWIVRKLALLVGLVLFGAALGGAAGFVVGLAAAPWYGWDAVLTGAGVGGYLGAHGAVAGGGGGSDDEADS